MDAIGRSAPLLTITKHHGTTRFEALICKGAIPALGPTQEVAVGQLRGDFRAFARAFRADNPDLILCFPRGEHGDRRVLVGKPAVGVHGDLRVANFFARRTLSPTVVELASKPVSVSQLSECSTRDLAPLPEVLVRGVRHLKPRSTKAQGPCPRDSQDRAAWRRSPDR
jgi:hypothetical protein